MIKLRLKSIDLRAASIQTVPLSRVTVVIGPNNSGKTLLLKEISEWCGANTSGRTNDWMKVCADIEVDWPDTEQNLLSLLDEVKVPSPNGINADQQNIWTQKSVFIGGQQPQSKQLAKNSITHAYQVPLNFLNIKEQALSPFVINLDIPTRLSLCRPQPAGHLTKKPTNHLLHLLKDIEMRRRFRKLVYEAFEYYPVIDSTGIQTLQLRLSSVEPEEIHETSFANEAIKFCEKAELIDNFGHGIQAFVGLLCAIMALPQRIQLLDEPEAFLHPTLARRLGKYLTEIAVEREGNLIASTHSADFLLGCINGSNDVNLIRLTYEASRATARMIEPTEVKLLANDPLLRTTGALQALFHRGVIVTEAASDRAFYDEINHRLQSENRGARDILFINGENWQTIARVIEPLRKLGVPAAAIIDLDTLGHPELSKFYTAYVPQNKQIEVQALHETCKSYFPDTSATEEYKATFKTNLVEKGMESFTIEQQNKLSALSKILSDYGVFVVPVGELEHWLKDLKVKGKRGWVPKIFEKMGADPISTSYIRPATDDVWKFIDSIAAWIDNNDRLGMSVN